MMQKLLGLPVLASEEGKGVDGLIIYVHILMGVLFVGWLVYFGYALWRFRQERHPRADHHGVRSHISNYLEIGVAGIEAALLIFIAIPLWARAADKFPDAKDSTVVQVVGQQFNWNFRYAGRDGALGQQAMRWVNETNVFGVDPADAAGKDDAQTLNEMHVPVNKPVIAYISSKDVIHSFKISAMRVTQDAIPGMRIPIHFKPTKEGSYRIYCAQLCGNGHAAMAQGLLVVDSPEAYDKWLAARTVGTTSYE
jgi:cytochrome c oxidase subunit 2